MLRQNALLRRHALGSFEHLAIEVTRDPAMLLWLNGVDNRKDDVNENYARELMELFTLGAGRGYTERDVREMARALTGFRNDWSDGRRPAQLPLRPRVARQRLQAHPRPAAAASTGATRVRLERPPPQAPVVHGGQALGLLHPDAAAARHGAGARADVRRARPQRPPAARRDPAPPAPLRPGPPDGQAAGRAGGRDAARASAAGSTPTRGRGCATRPARCCSSRRTCPAGTTRRWLDTATFRARWQMATEICNPARLDDEARKVSGQARRSSCAAPPRFWHTPLSRLHAQRARALRASRDGDRRRAVEARVLPRPDRERAAHARRRLPRLPDLVTTTTPASAAPSTPAPAPACPAIEPGMPTPAGTGLSRRSFLLRSAGLALSVYGAGQARPACRCSRRASPAPQAGGAGHGARQRVPRRRRRQHVDPRADRRPELPPAAPEPRAARRAAACSARTTRLTWHPAAAPLAALHAEGKVTVLPAVGYDHPDQSHFVSRHFWEVGATRRRSCARAGSAACSTASARADNPLQGVSHGRQPRPVARRRPGAGRRRRRARGLRLLDARRLGPARPTWRSRRSPTSAARSQGSRDPAVAQAARAAAFAGGVRAVAGAARQGRRADVHAAAPPTRRARSASRSGSPGSPRCSAPACRSAARRCRAPGAWDTHADQATDAHRRTSRSPPTACSRSSATSRRAGSPTACSRSCGRSSAAAPPRTGRAPTTARPASASSSARARPAA